jgi:predicted nucleotidyltransferase
MVAKIDNIFGSKTRAAVLTKLIMEPERKFYLRELARELGVSYSVLQSEKENLVGLGVLVEERRGKVNLVSIDKSLPFYSDLRGLIMKTSGAIGVLSKAIRSIDGVRLALVFGSFASGSETPLSDVDLLVVGDVGEELLIEVVERAEADIGREINYILWGFNEFVERGKVGHHLLRDIVGKPFVMLVGSEDEFRGSVEGRRDQTH